MRSFLSMPKNRYSHGWGTIWGSLFPSPTTNHHNTPPSIFFTPRSHFFTISLGILHNFVLQYGKGQKTFLSPCVTGVKRRWPRWAEQAEEGAGFPAGDGVPAGSPAEGAVQGASPAEGAVQGASPAEDAAGAAPVGAAGPPEGAAPLGEEVPTGPQGHRHRQGPMWAAGASRGHAPSLSR